jgi:uncharacterized protein YuzE
MKPHYDSEVDALYLRLNDAEIIESEGIQPGVILDFDDEDRVVGVEILHVKRKLPDADLRWMQTDMA